MFWGCFSYFGLGPLVRVDETMDSEKYIGTLQKYVLPELEAAKEEFEVDLVYMQDNAPCHKSRIVMDFLDAHRVPVMSWPAQSPDLNPIENLWAILKRRRMSRFPVPTTKDQLTEQIFTLWEELDQELIQKLARSFGNRCREVVRLKGDPTKY